MPIMASAGRSQDAAERGVPIGGLAVLGRLVLLAAAMAYCAGYFLCSDMGAGRLSGSSFSVRVFPARWQVVAWTPMLWAEKACRPREFYWYVGPWPPPPDVDPPPPVQSDEATD